VTEPLLTARGIEKAFGPVAVLRGIDLVLHGGEVHALLGENGAGKSTLMRILLGIERADRGTMNLGGAPYAPRGPGEARRVGVVMVPQERTLCPHLDVVQNIVLGIEPAGPLGIVRTSRRWRSPGARSRSWPARGGSRCMPGRER
jgi:ribose transport system ATP-binding protein